MSPGSKVISARRGVANSARTSASSSLMTWSQPAVVVEDRLELGDGLPQLGQLLLELGAAEPGEAAEGHVEDVVGLDLAELERLGHEARRGPRGRSSDARMRAMICVDHVERLEQALDDVGPVARPSCSRNSERRVMTSTWWAT